jgi:hypothetical protein
MANGMKSRNDWIIKNRVAGFDTPELRQEDRLTRIHRIQATLRRMTKRDLIDNDRLLIER